MNRSLVLQLAIVFCLISVSAVRADSRLVSLSSLNTWSLTERLTIEEPSVPSRSAPPQSFVTSAAQVMAFRWYRTTATLESLATTAAQGWRETLAGAQEAHAEVVDSVRDGCEWAVEGIAENVPVAVFRSALAKAESSRADRVTAKATGAAKNEALLPAIEPASQYWSYYADCDRWGVDLTRAITPAGDQTAGSQLAMASPAAETPEVGIAETAAANLTRLVQLARQAGDWLTNARQRLSVASRSGF